MWLGERISKQSTPKIAATSAKNGPRRLETMANGKKDLHCYAVYKLLEEGLGQQQQVRLNNFPFSKVWLCTAPSKICFFKWAILRGRTLTTDNLRKHKKFIVNRCSLCKQNEETIQHLFMDCPFTDGVRRVLTERLIDNWVAGIDINNRFQNRRCKKTWPTGNLTWKISAHAITKGIWKECNCRIFEDKSQSFEQDNILIKWIVWNCIKLDNTAESWKLNLQLEVSSLVMFFKQKRNPFTPLIE